MAPAGAGKGNTPHPRTPLFMPSKVAGAVVLLVLIGIGLFTGLWAAETAVSEQSTTTFVDDELVERNSGWNDLKTEGERYEVYNVTSNATGEQLERGTEWWADLDEGRLAFNETGSNVTVDYRAAEVDEQTATVIGILYPLYQLGSWLPFVAGVGAVLVGLQHLLTRGRRGAY